ncbi:YbaK/EbsC family protein [Halococcus sediminicola]|uniref:YbaK/EbsC family protein n=1 Tax=Halococcus sediminicola TaxID=1264579 RepID=UPI000678E355|nr:YbaK/EbsC family protein [Halococcus sediminicola]
MHRRAAAFAERADEEHDFAVDVHEFPAGTKTASDAAAAIGCDVAQIASSLVFVVPDPVVVVTSGANRVSEAKLAEVCAVDESAVGMADADVVRETVGWSIGGVPPFCHDSSLPVYMDDTLREFATVWAAAGTPEAVFPIAPERLRTLADAQPVDVAE